LANNAVSVRVPPDLDGVLAATPELVSPTRGPDSSISWAFSAYSTLAFANEALPSIYADVCGLKREKSSARICAVALRRFKCRLPDILIVVLDFEYCKLAGSYPRKHLICGQTWKTGKFLVLRKTIRQRLSAKLRALKEELRRRRHRSVAELGKWLRSVVQGYFNYHAVPGNLASLRSFRLQVIRRWMRALRRRSQKSRMTWPRLVAIADRWLPKPSILHPYPNLRFDATHPR
jgi:hypothetical protein